MFKMFKQAFAALSAFFTAVEHVANAGVEFAGWTEDEARAFREKEANKRAQAHILQQAEFAATNKALGITDEQIVAQRALEAPSVAKTKAKAA